MTKKRPSNVAASVRARLLQVAKASGEDFHYVLTRYALERLLLRLWREAEWLAPSLLQRRSTPSRDSRGRLSRQRAARDRSPRAGRPRDRGDSADGPSRRIARIAKRPRRRRGGRSEERRVG